MNRAIAAAMLCLCMAGTAWAEDIPDSAAVHDSIWAGYLMSNLADSDGTLGRFWAEQPGTEPWASLNPSLVQEEVRQFMAGIERMRNQSPQWAVKMDFATIEWRSLQDPYRTNVAGSTQMRDWLALQDATAIAPPIADTYRFTERWQQGVGGRSPNTRSLVDYNNQVERENGNGRLREIDPPFPTVLLLLGSVLIAMATIGRRSRPD